MSIKRQPSENKHKVAIVGAGFVGSTIAYALVLKQLAHEIVLIDVKLETSYAEAQDINHGIMELGFSNVYSGSYSDIKDSDLIIVTTGRNRRPGESRLDMTFDNLKIAESVIVEIKKNYTKGIVLVVANPVDIITYKMVKGLGLEKGKVFGTGCILDTSRFTRILADYLGVNPEGVNVEIIGEHGESQVLLWNSIRIDNMPIKEYFSKVNKSLGIDEKEKLEKSVIKMGADIIKGKGRTHYGIATCVCYIVDAILNGHKVVACVSTLFDGEYGITDVAMSFPSVIDINGVSKIVGQKLAEDELDKLQLSKKMLRNVLDRE